VSAVTVIKSAVQAESDHDGRAGVQLGDRDRRGRRMDSMSNAPYLLPKRARVTAGNGTLVDTVITTGSVRLTISIWDAPVK